MHHFVRGDWRRNSEICKIEYGNTTGECRRIPEAKSIEFYPKKSKKIRKMWHSFLYIEKICAIILICI